MASSQIPLNALAQQLKALHVPGDPLILSNVWDAGTARTVASLPCTKAIATASYAIGASIGLEDENTMTLTQNLDGITRVLAGVRLAGQTGTLPVTADLQDGYTDPATTVQGAIKLGIVGCNIEDVNHATQPPTLRPIDEATDRISAAVAAARDAGVPDFVVNARTDVLGHGGSLPDAIARGRSFLQAGATTVFVWGAMKHKLTVEDVETLVAQLDGKVAVLAQGLTVDSLRRCGVSRISIGPALHWRVLKNLQSEAEAVMEGHWSM